MHIDLGLRESYDDWLNFLRDMINRGLPTPTSITSDGAPGLMKAIDAVFPKSIRIRCWFLKDKRIFLIKFLQKYGHK